VARDEMTRSLRLAAVFSLAVWRTVVAGFGDDTPDCSLSSIESSPLAKTLLQKPIWVYNNRSAYDELSDRIPLTEELAMRELRQVEQLHRFGVHFEYDVMAAVWFSPSGLSRLAKAELAELPRSLGFPSAVAMESCRDCGLARTCS
jgi:hypothetical protein